MAITISLAAEPLPTDEKFNESVDRAWVHRGRASRFFSGRRFRWRRFVATCNKRPGICMLKGSPGASCCNRRCVNLGADSFNCGRCGRKCKFSEICCKGKCVNPSTHRKNCGGCNNRCKRGSTCMYAMCSYA
ncbi:Stigma-specific Stig1 family protein [Dorcoceras hygrometricum]|uniref:Stigma-specific Stig1 family protein n=1 Tax=Dorcoceras hygrometricum TaxID=472368 RepID=A0A2Z7DD35_9LAMI|nr:Stigma-specific Stig1 family protein [Dorcoceras hygrometricum]